MRTPAEPAAGSVSPARHRHRALPPVLARPQPARRTGPLGLAPALLALALALAAALPTAARAAAPALSLMTGADTAVGVSNGSLDTEASGTLTYTDTDPGDTGISASNPLGARLEGSTGAFDQSGSLATSYGTLLYGHPQASSTGDAANWEYELDVTNDDVLALAHNGTLTDSIEFCIDDDTGDSSDCDSNTLQVDIAITIQLLAVDDEVTLHEPFGQVGGSPPPNSGTTAIWHSQLNSDSAWPRANGDYNVLDNDLGAAGASVTFSGDAVLRAPSPRSAYPGALLTCTGGSGQDLVNIFTERASGAPAGSYAAEINWQYSRGSHNEGRAGKEHRQRLALGESDSCSFQYTVTAPGSAMVTSTGTLTFTVMGANYTPRITTGSASKHPQNSLLTARAIATVGEPFSGHFISRLIVDLDLSDTHTVTVRDLPDGLQYNPRTGNARSTLGQRFVLLGTITGTPTHAAYRAFIAGLGGQGTDRFPLGQRSVLTITDNNGASVEHEFVIPFANRPPEIRSPAPDVELEFGKAFSFTLEDDQFYDPDEGNLAPGQVLAPPWVNWDAATRTFSGTAPSRPRTGTGAGLVTMYAGSSDPRFYDGKTREIYEQTLRDQFTITLTDTPQNAPPAQNGEGAEGAEGAAEGAKGAESAESTASAPPAQGAEGSESAESGESAESPPLALGAESSESAGGSESAESGESTASAPLAQGAQGAQGSGGVTGAQGTSGLPRVNRELRPATYPAGAMFAHVLPEDVFTDNEDGTLTYDVVSSSLQTWLSYDSSTRTLSGTPPASAAGTWYEVTFSATDTDSNTIRTNFRVVVRAAGDGPQRRHDRDVNIQVLAGQTLVVDYHDYFVDPDGDQITLTLLGGTFASTCVGEVDDTRAERPDWATFDAATGVGTYTPPVGSEGSFRVAVFAETRDGNNEVRPCITVLPVGSNVPPRVAAGIPDQHARVGEAFSYAIPAGAFTDPGDTLSYTLLNQPTWLTYTAATATLAGTPQAADVTTSPAVVTVIASDSDGLVVSTRFGVTVSAAAAAPVVAVPIPPQYATEDEAWSFTVPAGTFSNASGQTLAYTSAAADRPSWVSFNASSGTFSATPTQARVGRPHSVSVTATDTNGVATAEFTLAVRNVNDAPTVASNVADVTRAIGGGQDVRVSMQGVFADTDPGGAATLRYAFQAKAADGTLGPLPHWLTYDVNIDRNLLFALEDRAATEWQPGTHTLVVTASDRGDDDVPFNADDLSVSDEFTITVTGTNSAPVLGLAIGADTTITEAGHNVVGDLEASGTFTFADPAESSPVFGTHGTIEGRPGVSGTGNTNTYMAAASGASVTLTGGHGTLTLMGAGTWTYAPTGSLDNRRGNTQLFDRFSFRIADDSTSTVYSNQLDLVITINGSNDAPTVVGTGIADLTVSQGDTVSLAVGAAFTDVDGTQGALGGAVDERDASYLRYSHSVAVDTSAAQVPTVQPSTWLTFFGGQFGGIAPEGSPGVYTVTVTATDPLGASVDDEFTLTVQGPPYRLSEADTPAPDKSVTEAGFAADGTATAGDPNASGALTLIDEDGNEATIGVAGILEVRVGEQPDRTTVPQGGQDFTGTYGRLSLDSDGTWEYTLNNDIAITNSLSASNPGEDRFGLRVMDGSNMMRAASDTLDLVITITGSNDPPVVPEVADQVVSEGGVLDVRLPVILDPEGDSVTHSYVVTTSAASGGDWIGYEATNRLFAGIAPTGSVGEHRVTITASDGTLEAIGSFIVEVHPVLTLEEEAGADKVVVEAGTADAGDSEAGGAVVFRDENGSRQPFGVGLTLEMRAGGLGVVGAFAPVAADGSHEVAGTYGDFTLMGDGSWHYTLDDTRAQALGEAEAEMDRFTLRAVRTGGTRPQRSNPLELAMAVVGSNDAPGVGAEIPAQEVPEEGTLAVSLEGVFTDPDRGNVFTYTYTVERVKIGGEVVGADADGVGAWITLSDDGQFGGSPPIGSRGRYLVTVTATDSAGASISTTFTITVIGSNQVPVLERAIDPGTVTAGEPFSRTIPQDTFRDPEGSGITYGAEDLPGWLMFDSPTRTFSGTPEAGDVGVHTVTVLGTDGVGLSGRAIFTLTVLERAEATARRRNIEQAMGAVARSMGWGAVDTVRRRIRMGGGAGAGVLELARDGSGSLDLARGDRLDLSQVGELARDRLRDELRERTAGYAVDDPSGRLRGLGAFSGHGGHAFGGVVGGAGGSSGAFGDGAGATGPLTITPGNGDREAFNALAFGGNHVDAMARPVAGLLDPRGAGLDAALGDSALGDSALGDSALDIDGLGDGLGVAALDALDGEAGIIWLPENARLWANASRSDLAFSPDDASFEGDTITTSLGVERGGDSGVVGIAISHVDGNLDIVDEKLNCGAGEPDCTGKFGLSQWSVTPYASREFKSARLWGLVGFGVGEMDYEDNYGHYGRSEAGVVESGNGDTQLRLAATGVELDFATYSLGSGTLDVVGRLEGMGVRLHSDGDESALDLFRGVNSDAYGVRGGIEMGWQVRSGNGSYRPYLTAGYRWDGGTVGNDVAAEYGAGITVRGGHFSLDASARGQGSGSSDMELEGYSIDLGYDNGGDGMGLTLNLRNTLGGAPALDPFAGTLNGLGGVGGFGGVGGNSGSGNVGGGSRARATMNLEAGYGIGTRLGVLRPHASAAFRGDVLNRTKLGLRLDAALGQLELLHTLRLAQSGASDEHALELRANITF